ncbi:MAG TPA: glycosyltransferase [Anaerolineales bacterium]|nr:glycosyltransferase [Anaerolineales bacterium]
MTQPSFENAMSMTSLKIAHVYKDYYPVLGGIENHIKVLAELQAASGHVVSAFVTNPGGQPERETMGGVDVHRLPRLGTLASTPLSLSFPGALRRFGPDITHLHFPYPVGEASQWLAGGGRPYVITYHSDVVRQKSILRLYRPILLRVLRGAARILPTSENYIASSPYLRPLHSKCRVVPLSVDPVSFQNAPRLVPKADTPTLLFVGRHRYYKGLGDLLKAMGGLDARLLVGGDGPMRRKWEALAGELDLRGKVRFLGDVPDEDLPGLYRSADIFVLPANARAEAFGTVLLEAMAAGLPCVTTELGTGTSFVVQDGITGLVVPPGDPASLQGAIGRLLEDGDLRVAMGEAGRRRVLAEFTPELLLQRVEAVYREILGL